MNQTPPTETIGSRQSDSDHSSSSSSSSSLLSPPASESERVDPDTVGSHRRRRAGSRRASSFLLDVVNEDSDSSSFWLDPLPRPRSPSPRENSSLSRTSSPSSSSSSSSTTSSNSDGEEAELQRSRVRQHNAARKQGRTRWSCLDSAQSIQSATDYSNYPKISLHDSTSPSSSGDESRLVRFGSKNKGRGITPIPGPSSESHAETQLRGRWFGVMDRAQSRVGQREELGAGRSSEDELNSSGLYGNSSAYDETCVDSTLPEFSEGAEPDANSEPAGSRTGKRTRFRSEPEEGEPPSEKN